MIDLNKEEYIHYMSKILERNKTILFGIVDKYKENDLDYAALVGAIDIIKSILSAHDSIIIAKTAGNEDYLYYLDPAQRTVVRGIKPVDEIEKRIDGEISNAKKNDYVG